MLTRGMKKSQCIKKLRNRKSRGFIRVLPILMFYTNNYLVDSSSEEKIHTCPLVINTCIIGKSLFIFLKNQHNNIENIIKHIEGEIKAN